MCNLILSLWGYIGLRSPLISEIYLMGKETQSKHDLVRNKINFLILLIFFKTSMHTHTYKHACFNTPYCKV
jgi:hypothetical protein